MAVVGLSAVWTLPAAGQAQPVQPKDEHLREVRAAAHQLIRDLEELQNVIVSDLSGIKERTLYRQADSALREALAFEEGLKTAVSRAELYKRFDQMDPKLHVLFKSVEALGAGERGVRRALHQVHATDDHLHFVLSAGDTSQERKQQVIARQAQALAAVAQELKQTANYSLGENPGGAVLIDGLKAFAQAAEVFQKRAADKNDLKILQGAFGDVNKAWHKVTEGLKQLPPGENVYLLRYAVRVDQLHERLFRLLDLPGDRPGLILRT